MQDYAKLEICNNAIEIGELTYKLSQTFPKSELYGLMSQMQRASFSISSNIAEGCSRRTKPDFIRFFEITLGSCFEIKSQLILSQKIGFIKDQAPFESLLSKLQIERKMIYNFNTANTVVCINLLPKTYNLELI